MNNDVKTVKQLNDIKKYFFEIKMHNPDGDEQVLNPRTVVYMVIEDELHFWPIKGCFIIENPYEIIERKFIASQAISNDLVRGIDKYDMVNDKPYVFRNDGRDFVDITIRRIAENFETGNAPVVQPSPEIWEMKFNCVIYAQEDVESLDMSTKRKKYYFWDVDYQRMLDKHIQWSTATSKYNDAWMANGSKYIPNQATDNDRKMFTGSAIKAMLVENGFAVTDDKEKFDKGSTKIFYSAFQNNHLWENLDYLLNQHMSEKTGGNQPIDISDICIFDKDRHTHKFELCPIHKIFEKAGHTPDLPNKKDGMYQIEHLIFEEMFGNKSGGISSFKSPLIKTINTEKDISLTKIRRYKYVDMSAVDGSQILVTTPVHSYNFKDKTFSINTTDSNIVKLEQTLKTLYIENKFLTKNGSHPMLTLNKNKIANNVVYPVYSPRCDKPAIINRGLGRLLYSSLFLNQCLVLTLDGETIRRPGRFIGIDRGGFSDNTLDYKLCGQWFVTGVKHIFAGEMYANECTCVKMHSYDTLNIRQDVD